MKKTLFFVVFMVFVFGNTNAQFMKRAEVCYPLNWHLLSYDGKDTVYGTEVNKAYEFLRGKEKKKRVVVAIIDSGCDDLHEDLRKVLWVNKGEIPGDGIDNDGDGYVDDVHGWNFLGTKDGKMIEKTMEEGARAFLKIRDRYDALMNKERDQKEEAEWKRMKQILLTSRLGKGYLTIDLGRQMAKKVEDFDRELKVKFPGEEITMDQFCSLMNPSETDTVRVAAHLILAMGWNAQPNATWKQWYDNRFMSETMAKEEFETMLKKQEDQRDQVGDDLENVKDRVYGNSILLSSNSEHGTHVAGIIGAMRGNGIGMEGVADNVELMILRAIPDGDEYDKDVALAIRYAVEHGANIINMSFGKKCSTREKWVTDALKYAEKKGVLVVHGAGNDFANSDVNLFYPTNRAGKAKKLSNFINVGASDPKGQPAILSNYGKESVDVFAPGVAIYSTIPGDTYKKMGGTSMASPVVAGIAALIMTYYPELSAKQVRDVILQSAVVRHGAEVMLPQEPTLAVSRDLVPFTDLCVGGGIVSAFEAVKLAERLVSKKE